MDESHQKKTESGSAVTKYEHHPVLVKDQKEPDHSQSNRMRINIKWFGIFGYDKETKEYNPNGSLTKITKEYQPGKTLWDWLQFIGVLLIPFVIFLATMRFNQQQADLAQQQHANDQKTALDQQQATILQTYIDNIQDLLLNHNLLISKSDDAVAIIARARTLTALRGLDPGRKGRLLIFLYEAKLIGFGDVGNRGEFNTHSPIIALNGADLSDAILSGVTLAGADLSSANFTKAHLDGAELSGAILSHATLVGVDLSYAHLQGTTLDGADLNGANLGNADFVGADLLGADLQHINIRETHFDFANLAGTNLSGTNLGNAILNNTYLNGAEFDGANLSGVRYLTQQQLDQVFTCKNAMLPKDLICHSNQ